MNRRPDPTSGARHEASEADASELEQGGPSWVWGARAAPPGLIRSFEGAIAAWDRHIQSCRACLHQGRWFCSDGEILTRRVAAARDALAPRVKARRRVTISLAIGGLVSWNLTAQFP